jgi:hypothetical protein
MVFLTMVDELGFEINTMMTVNIQNYITLCIF